jgi:hypothetical protein
MLLLPSYFFQPNRPIEEQGDSSAPAMHRSFLRGSGSAAPAQLGVAWVHGSLVRRADVSKQAGIFANLPRPGLHGMEVVHQR